MLQANNKSEIFNYLMDLGCCRNCSLRYLCDKSLDFNKATEYIEQHNLLQTAIKDEEQHAQEAKKSKGNYCVVCLGLLQDVSVDNIMANSQLLTVEQYDTKVFTCSISMPPAVLVREHSMRLKVEDKFPEFFTDDNQEIPINRVWKMFIKDKLEKHLNKTFESSDICAFSINIITDYEDDAGELEVLKSMQPKMFEDRKTQHRKYNGEVFSRKGVLTALSRTSSGTFRMFANVPPEVPTKTLFCKSIECRHDSIFVAGRYCKYSRDLSQSPWIIDGVKTMETSVQEIIFERVTSVFGIPEKCLVFSSSGREDCDVRCVGRGRPFYVEILDPKKTQYTFTDFRMLEEAINVSKLIKVVDLQLVNRCDLVKIKEGEESKTKNYTALCILKKPVVSQHIDKINSYGAFTIKQKTPMRVLHRRPVAVRERTIHSLKAETVPDHPNHFILHLQTQAGTYVKEFVHGDFCRTKPSMGDIINEEVDILALDVTAINLDWPKPIDYA